MSYRRSSRGFEPQSKMNKIEHFPRIHKFDNKFMLSAALTAKESTSYVVINYDEGQGDPASARVNKQHASFAIKGGPSCYPESRVNKVMCRVDMNLTKHCWNVDKIEMLNVYIIPYFFAFKEDYDAKDELTGNTVKALLETVYETTDRQGGPIYDGVDVQNGDDIDIHPDLAYLLTTDNKLEHVIFNYLDYVNARKYYSNRGKLKAVAPQVFWKRVTRHRGASFKLSFNVRSKIKKMNEYTLCGFILGVPNDVSVYQTTDGADASVTDGHVQFQIKTMFNEWNPNFNMART